MGAASDLLAFTNNLQWFARLLLLLGWDSTESIILRSTDVHVTCILLGLFDLHWALAPLLLTAFADGNHFSPHR